MKKYTTDIAKLYETVGYEKIEKGKTYVTAKGGKVKVNDIYIDATQASPETYVVYEYETTEGNKGSETNHFGVVVEMLRNS
jgi:hypothetical protein